MKIEYGRNSFSSFERGQENCYMLTNGLGGYSSMTILLSNGRNDHALLMAAVEAPGHRVHMITRTDETVCVKEKKYDISSQQFVGYTSNREGFRYLDFFSMEYLPVWVYRVPGIEIRKTLVMPQMCNTVGISYEIINRTKDTAVLEVTPLMQFTGKGERCQTSKSFQIKEGRISDGKYEIHYKTDGAIEEFDTEYVEDLYFEYDARDGRKAIGGAYKNHHVKFQIPPGKRVIKELIYSMEPIVMEDCQQMIRQEISRQKELERVAGLKDETAALIAKNCNQYIVRRDSVQGKSIIAGYPFFGDWGRDTMIALPGCCICTGQLETAENILRTFLSYRYQGLMPNVFPEEGGEPAYNTVDAALLFAISVYEFYCAGGNQEFVRNEAYPAIKETIEWYQKGTDYHIKMDEDGLLMAGSGLEQVTWMDVRIEGVLPTPRHGKPVEINAEWYNTIKIAEFFGILFHDNVSEYTALSETIKSSFGEQFWISEKEYLRDVISGTKADEQIRCNQIWAVSLPFSILEREEEIKVVDKVYEHLYTPYGLRTLSQEDKEFCATYGGCLKDRDMSYHQGTVWTFPLGAYYLAYLKVFDYSQAAKKTVKEQLAPMGELLREGCIGHLAEIYDGLYPTVARGCFAQAWSMGEILKVYWMLENHVEN